MLRGMADKGLSPRTQNLARATLRKALNDAIDGDLLTSNAAAKARPAKQESKQVSPLSPAEVRTLLDSTRDHRYGPLIHVAIGTGMRQGELRGLRWEDVDFDNAVLRVKHSMQMVDGKPTFTPTKTEKSRRTIALDPSTLDALRRQQQMVTELKAIAGDKWTEWYLVFPSTVGTPLNASNVTHQFQKLVEKAGLPRQRFHDLRHCTASLIASQGGDIKAIQEALGHSQIALTANTYTHFYDEMRRDTANRIGAALSGLTLAKGSD
jgi:integrase